MDLLYHNQIRLYNIIYNISNELIDLNYEISESMHKFSKYFYRLLHDIEKLIKNINEQIEINDINEKINIYTLEQIEQYKQIMIWFMDFPLLSRIKIITLAQMNSCMLAEYYFLQNRDINKNKKQQLLNYHFYQNEQLEYLLNYYLEHLIETKNLIFNSSNICKKCITIEEQLIIHIFIYFSLPILTYSQPDDEVREVPSSLLTLLYKKIDNQRDNIHDLLNKIIN